MRMAHSVPDGPLCHAGRYADRTKLDREVIGRFGDQTESNDRLFHHVDFAHAKYPEAL